MDIIQVYLHHSLYKSPYAQIQVTGYVQAFTPNYDQSLKAAHQSSV